MFTSEECAIELMSHRLGASNVASGVRKSLKCTPALAETPLEWGDVQIHHVVLKRTDGTELRRKSGD